MNFDEVIKSPICVIPAKAGIHKRLINTFTFPPNAWEKAAQT